jgi:hypothetical protein
MFERWGHQWECIRGYALVEPEGWFLELWDRSNSSLEELVLIARWPDGGDLSVTPYRAGLAPEVVDWFTDEARLAIAPIDTKPNAEHNPAGA